MSKYIDAERFAKDLDNKFDNLFHNGIETISTLDVKNILMNILIEQPAVDAVEVVRCEDCKHRFSSLCSTHSVEYDSENEPDITWGINEPDGFCSHGERIEQ